MRTRPLHLSSRFVFALLLFVCLVVGACSSSPSTPTTRATPTVGTPAFATRLQPLLVAKMQQLHIPGAMDFVELPGHGSIMKGSLS